MNHRDADKLAQESWDAVSDTPYAVTHIDHQLRLCTLVNAIEAQIERGVNPTTNSAGLENFEAEVVRRLTAPVPAPKQLKAPKDSVVKDSKEK